MFPKTWAIFGMDGPSLHLPLPAGHHALNGNRTLIAHVLMFRLPVLGNEVYQLDTSTSTGLSELSRCVSFKKFITLVTIISLK